MNHYFSGSFFCPCHHNNYIFLIRKKGKCLFFLKRKGIWFCNKNIKLKILYMVKLNYLIRNARL